jgi:hypothetical protein
VTYGIGNEDVEYKDREMLTDATSGEGSKSPGVTPCDQLVTDDSSHAGTFRDAVEAALADAIAKAANEGRFDVVSQLARELEARRLARADVVSLDAEKRRRSR